MSETNLTEQLEELLEKNGLKKTKPRLSVLEILSNSKAAISQPDLEKVLGKDTDRVTLYRTLNTFEEKGIIHKIIDLNGTANYAICDSTICDDHGHRDEHVHFNCTICLHIYCLETLEIPILKMPGKFQASSFHLLVYGVCEGCSDKTAVSVGTMND